MPLSPWLVHPAFPTLMAFVLVLAAPRPGLGAALVESGSPGASPLGPAGTGLHYLPAGTAPSSPAPSAIRDLIAVAGPVEWRGNQPFQWLSIQATCGDDRRFQAWFLASAYPPADRAKAQAVVARYILREGGLPPVEYHDRIQDRALLPSLGGWTHLIPRPAEGSNGSLDFAAPPVEVTFLGHRFRLHEPEPGSTPASLQAVPVVGTTRHLRSDMLVGLPSNQRQKDETRRYDTSDYEYTRLTREDYRTMVEAGFNCLRVDAAQLPWVLDLDAFHWGPGPGDVPFPECLYRSTYLGPALFLDEPAVGTRDHVLRPKLARDPEFRRTLTPAIALEAFREHFHEVLRNGAPTAFQRALGARPGIDPGTLRLVQENLYSWDTMPATAVIQLTADPLAPSAMVFEPPGRLGSRRTLPELNMTYGCQLPIDNPGHLTRILYGFLRGAARLSGRDWGTSVYGAVDRVDAPWFLTHAYDMGATHFFCWDNYQLACVPFGECLALARHLRAHADTHPHRDLDRLRSAAELLILLPPGYNLGHVHLGRGNLWGLPELNLERRNAAGVTYRAVMSAVFAEIERCLRDGTAFDLLWDLPGTIPPKGYREVVRIREDATLLVPDGASRPNSGNPRPIPRPGGASPQLAVDLAPAPPRAAAPAAFDATATVTETVAQVFYTTGTDPRGVQHNAIVDWELFGPEDPDYRHLAPPDHRPTVESRGGHHIVHSRFTVERPGRYRLRAAVCDTAGRTTVSWTEFTVPHGLQEAAAAAPGNPPSPVPEPAVDGAAWLEQATRGLLEGCRVRADDGTWLYTPDGKGNYRALWTRDFAYMVENAGDLMPAHDVEAALRTLLRGLRADGATPDRVQPDGVAVYTGGPPDRPLGEPNLDNGPFLAIAVDEHLARLPRDQSQPLFREWAMGLQRAMDWVPRAPSGLVWNDPRRPHSPYGFTDTIGKTGELLFESLLYWDACRRLAARHRQAGNPPAAAAYEDRAGRIARSLGVLWDEQAGAFLAATRDCRQLDVWGNAFAIWLDIPLGTRRDRILSWLLEHRGRFLRHGQVRHLLAGEHWQRLLAPVEPERYQNGAYWATASGWVLHALAQRDPALARSLWIELVADFRSGGICECVNEGYRQLPSYVVSATNPLAFARRHRLSPTPRQ